MACPRNAYPTPPYPEANGPYCVDCGVGNAEERCEICGDTMCWTCHLGTPRCDDCIEKQNEYEDRRSERQKIIDDIFYDDIHYGDD